MLISFQETKILISRNCGMDFQMNAVLRDWLTELTITLTVQENHDQQPKTAKS